MATQYGSQRRYRTNSLKEPTKDDQTLTTSYSVATQESGQTRSAGHVSGTMRSQGGLSRELRQGIQNRTGNSGKLDRNGPLKLKDTID